MEKILVIDDNKEIRELITKTLSNNGYIVLEAENGKKGCELYKEHNIKLVIVDIFMPEKDGIETINEIKSDNPEAKVIAISGEPSQLFLNIVKNLGADHILNKPLKIDKFLGTVHSLLNS